MVAPYSLKKYTSCRSNPWILMILPTLWKMNFTLIEPSSIRKAPGISVQGVDKDINWKSIYHFRAIIKIYFILLADP